MGFPQSTSDTLNASRRVVQESLAVLNEEPIIGDSATLTIDELKLRAMGAFSAQNRAVTKQDYESLAYRMPPGLGSIYNCNVVQDPDSTRRNMNFYVISKLTSYPDKVLTNTNLVTKENLKTWIERHKMITDTIDIKDARIVNFGIEYKIKTNTGTMPFKVFVNIRESIIDFLSNLNLSIGEPFPWADLYKVLNGINGVLDTTNIKLTQKFSSNYSSTTIDFEENMSMDGRTLYVPEDVILELKFPDTDIVGTVL